MHPDYRPQEIEAAVQAYWESEQSFAAQVSDKEKFYCLAMFPYPSGRLHMGHVRNYTIGDVIARYQRMQGRNVMQPMGFDAFGLPAENAAIKSGVAPAAWTYANMDYMRRQLKRLGFAYDWKRELATCRPDYYRWQQWFFIRLLKKGLVERRSSIVNWDPIDQTVLANEQVIDGRGWRSGALVEQREIPQWFLRITDYAEELLRGLDTLPGWPDAVKVMQQNWIGRSEGLEIDFQVEGSDQHITVFTTRPDTLLGVTYLALAPTHPITLACAEHDAAVAEFAETARKSGVAEATLSTQEKRGVPLGIHVIHPLTGERIPVWSANFVLMGYGSGAVMSVPAHDQRDWEFAQAYGLSRKVVIGPSAGVQPDVSQAAYTDQGVCVDCGAPYDGLAFGAAFDAIANALAAQGCGRRRVNYRLRDWGVSRQRYWGCPIPVIYCDVCGAVPVPEDQLPVLLPEDLKPDGAGNPLAKHAAFVTSRCPGCGSAARRETDTFDTFIDSSWYYARFACPGQDQAMLDDAAKYWLPIDQYVGGIEHAVLHLLYARFFQKAMRDEGLVPVDEPFTRLLTQGMVVASTYYRQDASGKKTWYNPADVDVQKDERGTPLSAVLREDGQPVSSGGIEKMSKSKNNGVDPQAMIEAYGADAVRLFMMFAAPPEASLEWSEAGLEGAARFLKRLWRLTADHVQAGPAPGLNVGNLDGPRRDLRRKLHDTLRRMGDDLGRRYSFNTAIAAAMELLNALYKFEVKSTDDRACVREALVALVSALSPIVPHITHELWAALGQSGPVLSAAWPAVDESALVSDVRTLVVQVNGKLRGEITVPASCDAKQAEAAALACESVQRFLNGRTPRKIIVVPGKLVNLVVPQD